MPRRRTGVRDHLAPATPVIRCSNPGWIQAGRAVDRMGPVYPSGGIDGVATKTNFSLVPRDEVSLVSRSRFVAKEWGGVVIGVDELLYARPLTNQPPFHTHTHTRTPNLHTQPVLLRFLPPRHRLARTSAAPAPRVPHAAKPPSTPPHLEQPSELLCFARCYLCDISSKLADLCAME